LDKKSCLTRKLLVRFLCDFTGQRILVGSDVTMRVCPYLSGREGGGCTYLCSPLTIIHLYFFCLPTALVKIAVKAQFAQPYRICTHIHIKNG